MTHGVRRHADPDAFLAAAGAWLLRSEAENNLILAVAEALKTGAQTSEGPPYLATVEDGSGELAGCVIRTPPFKLLLSRLPAEAMDPMVQDVARAYRALPGVMGPEPGAGAFAERWAGLRGVEARPGMEMRIHELSEVREVPDPPGAARWAGNADVELVASWVRAFGRDAGVPAPRPGSKARRLVEDRALALWEDGGRPVAMAARSGRTPHGARIGWVYTPPELRGRGYGTGITAWLSRRLLESGLRWCFLYTDLANPTSNRIYRRIGYRPVADVRDHEFGEPGGDAGSPAS